MALGRPIGKVNPFPKPTSTAREPKKPRGDGLGRLFTGAMEEPNFIHGLVQRA